VERLAEGPKNQEQLKSFDIMAGVDMFRYDLDNFGYILPQTRERVAMEHKSHLAEAVGRPAYTAFELKRGEDGDLIYFDRGRWKPYMSMLTTGLEVAEKEASQDLRRSFLANWAAKDMQRGYQMQQLEPGQQMVWSSAYPKEQAERFGDEFITKCGFDPEREMGYIYRASCQWDGSILLESQTIDRSDPDGLAAVEEAAGFDPEIGIDELRMHYDWQMGKKFGGEFVAGRRDAEASENAWATLDQHTDLVDDFYLQELERLAAANLPRHLLKKRVKETTYGVWASLKKRIDGEDWVVEATRPGILSGYVQTSAAMPRDIRHEVQHAFRDFAGRGKIMLGCGGSIEEQYGTDENDVFNASVSDITNNIFGRKKGLYPGDGEDYDFNLKMYCVECQKPPKENESKKMCGPCGLCMDCDAKKGGKASKKKRRVQLVA
jgi:hypothetical protein